MTDRHEDEESITARLGRAGAATGRFALRPARAVARQGRDALADEAERAIDGIMAGPLPEAIGRSLVEHQVIERVVAEALEAKAHEAVAPPLDEARMVELVHRVTESPALERVIKEAIDSRLTTELADRVVHSPAFKQTLRTVLSSPEVRSALAQQTAGFGGEIAAALRRAGKRVDGSLEGAARRLIRRPRPDGVPVPYGGFGTRGIALVTDILIIHLIFLVGGALIGLVSSLFGTLRPTWLVGLLTAFGWLIVVSLYFIVLWATTGQTAGMRLMRLRLLRGDSPPPLWDSALRLPVLAVSIVFFFLGLLPVLVDDRRRALQDFVAGTVVVYEPEPDDEGAELSSASDDAAGVALANS